MARHAKDESGSTPLGKDCPHLRSRAGIIAAHEDRRVGPGASALRQPPHQDQRIFSARGPFPRPEAGGRQRVGGAVTDRQGQRAKALGVMVIDSQLLRAMRGLRGVIEVEDHRRRGGGGVGHEVVNKRVGKAVEIGAGHTVFEPGERRGTRQVLRGIERETCDAQLQQGIRPATIGIIAVRIAGGDLLEARGEEVPERLVNIRWMALVAHGGSQPLGEADLAGNTPPQQGAKVS
jgi:hypothetical protein